MLLFCLHAVDGFSAWENWKDQIGDHFKNSKLLTKRSYIVVLIIKYIKLKSLEIERICHVFVRTLQIVQT